MQFYFDQVDFKFLELSSSFKKSFILTMLVASN